MKKLIKHLYQVFLRKMINKDFWFNLKYNIYSYFDKFYSPIRNIIYGIENLFKWFKFAYQDRDWDNWYFEKMLHFKLTNMVKFHKKYSHNSESDKIIKQIQFTIRILDRMLNNWDDYIHPAYQAYLDEQHDGWFNRHKSPEELKLWWKWHDWELHRRKRDRKLLSWMLEKYLETWWD